MFIVVVPFIHPEQPQKPPTQAGCAYQVEIDSQTWRCMTTQEYQSYHAEQQVNFDNNVKAFTDTLFHWGWIIPVGWFTLFVLVKILNKMGFN